MAYAADQSLPGSPLFGLDRAIEKARLKLSPNAATRVQLELNFAEERLQEADRLSARGDAQHLQDALAIYTSLISDAAHEAASQPGSDLVTVVDHRLSGYRTQIEALRIAPPQGSQQALDEALRASEPEFAVTPISPTEPSSDLTTTSPSGGSEGEHDQQVRAAACDMGREQPHIADLAALYGTTYDTILARFCGGESLGSINEAYSISQTTGVSVDDIFAMEQSGMSWGAIKQTLDSRGQGQGNSGQGQGNSNGGQGNGNGNGGQGNGNGNGNNGHSTPNPPGQSGDKDNNGKGHDK